MVVPVIVAVGRALTVTVADPVLSPACVTQRFASNNVANVYVVVPDGETLTDIGEEFPLKAVPSDNVPFQGPVPVTTMLRFVESPLHIVDDPSKTDVGRALTVTVADPVMSEAIPAQLPSATESNV